MRSLLSQKQKTEGVGEVAQGLSALAALVEDPGSVPSNHTRLTLLQTPAPGNPLPSSSLGGQQAHKPGKILTYIKIT